MMNWSDTTLMAFVDGELDPVLRAALEQALPADAVLLQRVEALAQQRRRVAAAYAPVLDEPVPDRLARLLATPAPVVDLAAVRARRRPPASWLQWGGMAAALLVGVVVGGVAGLGPHTEGNPPAGDLALVLRDGQLVAAGGMGQALSSQLASEPAAGAPVAVQLSFVDQGGSYCRTFSTAAVAGLACRQAGQWRVQVLAVSDPAADPVADPATPGSVRPAATALPRAVLEAVDQRITGTALDPGRERQARDLGWQR